jgi:hypothetical protein
MKLEGVMSILGIDLAGSEKRPTGIAYFKDNRILTKVVYKDEEILKIAKNFSKIFIDAPLSLPKGRDSLEVNNGIHFRECDIKLRKLKIKFFPLTLGPMRKLTERAIKLKIILKEQNKKVFEVFPGGFYDIMKLSRKNKEEIIKFYKNLGFELEDKKFIQDELDAIACLLTGLMHEKGESFILDGIDGSIILPRIENNLKLRSY